MIRLLIAEDERHMRENIIHSINWQDHGFILCGLAENGVEALDLTRKLNPDLILMDIKMPQMDGLEAVRQLSKSPDCPSVIMLSGFSDFSYVRQALQLGALDYILKPYTNTELIDTLIKAKQTILQRRVARRELEITKSHLREKLFCDLLEGKNVPWRRHFKRLSIMLGKKTVCIMVIRLDRKNMPSDDVRNASPQNAFIDQTRMVKSIKENFSQEFECEVFSYLNNVTVIFEAGAPEATLRKKMHSAVMATKDALEESMEYTLSIGIGNRVQAPGEWQSSFKHALVALDSGFFYGGGSVFLYKDIEPLLSTPWHYPHDGHNQIIKGIKANDAELIQKGTASFVAELQKISIHRQAAISVAFSFLHTLHDMTKALGIDDAVLFSTSLQSLQYIESFTQLSAELEKLIAEVSKLFQKQNSCSLIVKRAIAYIQENYAKDISLNSIAEEIHVSPAYLSALFSQETGCKLNHYIGKVRIEDACRLLQDPEMKIYEVALAVGFQDEKYFFSVFKKHIGTTPQQYRRLSGGPAQPFA